MLGDEDDCVFRLLGPVQVSVSDHRVAFSRRQQADLLAFLLLHLDRLVTVEQIVDAMWGEAVPRTVYSQINNMVSSLRAALVFKGQPLASVQRHPAGYQLTIRSGRLDLATFTSLAEQAQRAASPHEAVTLWRAALRLWRGEHALAGVRAPFASAARIHLAEQRNALREQLFDVELSTGNHCGIIAELTETVAGHPARERAVAQLMTALYRSGRAVDALAVFRHTRETLVGEYGLEPGAALRDLERMILVGQRPGATGTDVQQQAETRVESAALAIPAQLPIDVRGFAGRQTELATLDQLIAGSADPPAAAVVCVVTGTAGVGKTTTAVHWAHRVRDRFPDGQLFLNLRGFAPNSPPMSTGDAVRALLDAFGVPPESVPLGVDAQAALYRSLVAGRRILVLLDNAVDSEQVLPLLPAAPGSVAIVTSRNHLTALIATQGAQPLTLDVLAEADARQLFVARIGLPRVTAEEEAVARLVRQCARLPLALSLAAARAATHPRFSLSSLSQELIAGPEGAAELNSVFSWSYLRLTDEAAALFRLLGSHPGPDIGVAAAASLAGRDQNWAAMRLRELAHAHLVMEHEPGRYAMHDLLRDYATDRCAASDSEHQTSSAVLRVLDYYLHTAYAGALALYAHRYPMALPPAQPQIAQATFAGTEDAQEWFTTEHHVLIAAVERAASEGLSQHAWQLASALSTFLSRRAHWHDWVSVQHHAVAATRRLDDREGQAHALGELGLAHNRLGEFEQAHLNLQRSLDLFKQLDDAPSQARIHLLIDSVYEKQGDHQSSLGHAQAALDLYRHAGHLAGQAQSSNSIGWLYAQLGEFEQAAAFCAQAVAIHRDVGDRQGMAQALDSLGFVRHQLGQHALAAAAYQQAISELRAVGDVYHQPIPLVHLGETYQAAGQTRKTRRAWMQALAILDQLGHPEAEKLRVRLHALENAS